MLLMNLIKFSSVLGILAHLTHADKKQIFHMCVSQIYYDDCLNLLKDPVNVLGMDCVKGRDRIDCLDVIIQGKADVMALEPEDMYIAYHTKNANYRIVSEMRTQKDKYGDFRYKAIILIKKKSNFHSLKDLHGAKSCHTGFERDSGYKIPITKLKNLYLLKMSLNPELIATERELKALSEFFTQSCLVGTYSPYPEFDHLLKKKYSNLCALCENPEKCNYPDKFSGFDDAIRCLDKDRGEVAFTKVEFVEKYFGMLPGTTAEGDASEFVYLCEDGTRRAITGPACSWGQRPWTGYISTVDAVNDNEKLQNLQYYLKKFFTNGLHNQNSQSYRHLLINPTAEYYSKPTVVDSKEYLEKADYTDVIERDGFANRIMKMCIHTDIEMKKCDAMRLAAYSRDIRPEIECVQEKNCFVAIKEHRADMAAVPANNYTKAREKKLKPIVYEDYGPDNVYVAVVDTFLTKNNIQNIPIHYNGQDERAEKAAAYLNKLRGINTCKTTPSPQKNIMIVNSKDLTQYSNKQLLCNNLEKKPINDFLNCNLETNLPVAVFIRESMTLAEQMAVKHIFFSLSKKFGKSGYWFDVFNLFGEFKENEKNVLFNDNAVEFTTQLKNSHVNEVIFNSLKCDVIALIKESMTPEQEKTIEQIYNTFSDILGKRLEITQQ